MRHGGGGGGTSHKHHSPKRDTQQTGAYQRRLEARGLVRAPAMPGLDWLRKHQSTPDWLAKHPWITTGRPGADTLTDVAILAPGIL